MNHGMYVDLTLMRALQIFQDDRKMGIAECLLALRTWRRRFFGKANDIFLIKQHTHRHKIESEMNKCMPS